MKTSQWNRVIESNNKLSIKAWIGILCVSIAGAALIAEACGHQQAANESQTNWSCQSGTVNLAEGTGCSRYTEVNSEIIFCYNLDTNSANYWSECYTSNTVNGTTTVHIEEGYCTNGFYVNGTSATCYLTNDEQRIWGTNNAKTHTKDCDYSEIR